MQKSSSEPRWQTATAKAFHLHEWTFSLQPSGNPFSPADNDITAEIRLPTGETIRQPAFWDGDNTWKVRLALLRSGRIHWRLLKNGSPLSVSAWVEVKPISSQATLGFVRRHPRLKQFTTDAGKTFYPIGQNVGWRTPSTDYPLFFEQMSQAGMNWARIWLCHWDGKNPDWVMSKRMEPGWLDMEVIRRLEKIVHLAERFGIYIQLTLQHHGQYSTRTNPNWAENPWNKQHGGFLDTPEQFFTHPRALELTRHKYRYLVARWGYSPHLMAWELFNEVEWTDAAANGKWDVIAQWHREMARFLRSIDVHQHLITTSSAMDVPSLWVEMDYYQPHYYVPDIAGTLFEMTPARRNKPIFIGEWGGANPRQWGDEAFLRQGLWVGVMRGLAGGAQWWSWETTEARKWYAQWASLSQFLKMAGFVSGNLWQPISAQVMSKARAPFRFSPGGGWESTQRYRFIVPTDGSAIEGLSLLSRFIQGESHRDMCREPVVFEVEFAQAGRCTLHIGTVARSGAGIIVRLDNEIVAQERFSSAQRDTFVNREITFPVPAGKHTISVCNPGPDWFTLDSVTLTPYAPPNKVAVCGDGQNAMWYLWREQPVDASVTLKIPSTPPGRYKVTWWNPSTGRAIHTETVAVAQGGLALKVPVHERDIAGCLSPAGRRASL